MGRVLQLDLSASEACRRFQCEVRCSAAAPDFGALSAKATGPATGIVIDESHFEAAIVGQFVVNEVSSTERSPPGDLHRNHVSAGSRWCEPHGRT